MTRDEAEDAVARLMIAVAGCPTEDDALEALQACVAALLLDRTHEQVEAWVTALRASLASEQDASPTPGSDAN